MIYTKDNKNITVSDRFVYEEDLYLNYPNRCELYQSKKYVSKSLIEKKNSKAYSPAYGCYVQRFWEIVAAPEQYLLEQGFKPKA